MYDDQDNYDEEEDDRDPYAVECSSVESMAAKVREYLQDRMVVESPLTDEEVDALLAKPEAQKIIESAVSLRSYAYYAGDQIAKLGV